MCGRGACVVGGMHGRGGVGGVCGRGGWGVCDRGCVGGGRAWHTVNERAVRILLECILVFDIKMTHILPTPPSRAT